MTTSTAVHYHLDGYIAHPGTSCRSCEDEWKGNPMTLQLTPEMAEKVLAALPETGNGNWVVQQKLLSKRSKEGNITTVLGVAQILGPGDKMVGQFISLAPLTYRPNGTAGYWYIVQMANAGWAEDGMVPLPEQET
jgi:hypothetical protein